MNALVSHSGVQIAGIGTWICFSRNDKCVYSVCQSACACACALQLPEIKSRIRYKFELVDDKLAHRFVHDSSYLDNVLNKYSKNLKRAYFPKALPVEESCNK